MSNTQRESWLNAVAQLPLGELEPGTRFRLPDCGKTGVLLRTGACGSMVKYHGTDRDVAFTPKAGDVEMEPVAFTAPGRSVQISAGTIVEVI